MKSVQTEAVYVPGLTASSYFDVLAPFRFIISPEKLVEKNIYQHILYSLCVVLLH